MSNNKNASSAPRISTGAPGLDIILGGGLTPERVYLLEGTPGAGKTTLGLQFLRDGVARGERCLYLALSETTAELEAVAESHGWDLAGIDVVELVSDENLGAEFQQSVFHPSEVELGETTDRIMEYTTRIAPSRVVFDSLSEFRLLAQSPLRYRRQILALKQFLSQRGCTVMLLDDGTARGGDVQLHSIVHGVITLEQQPREFGKERRRLSVLKMRGLKFAGGYHDYALETGGLQVFPRLVAADHNIDFKPAMRATGSPELDKLLGGGLMAGTNALFMGPSGVGKTSLATLCAKAAMDRGERAAFYLFDEGTATFFARSAALGLDMAPYLADGRLQIHHIDPAELAPGEFAHMLRTSVERDNVKFAVIDSLNAYLQAMPGEQFLILQMHELLTYLNQRGVVTVLALGEHGLVGQLRTEVDLSYLSDTGVLLRFFESGGKLRRAITIPKSRVAAHEQSIHEFRLTSAGIVLGDALEGFEGILTGLPAYTGGSPMLHPE